MCIYVRISIENKSRSNRVMLPECVLNTEEFVKNSCKIRLQITMLWAGHDFAPRSCRDLDLQGSDPNFACNTSS